MDIRNRMAVTVVVGVVSGVVVYFAAVAVRLLFHSRRKPHLLDSREALALDHLERFRDESIRLIQIKLDFAQANAIRLRRRIKSVTSRTMLTTPSQDSSTESSSESLSSEMSLTWEQNRASAEISPSISSINPDCFLSVGDMIRRHGYPCEEITVETADGYLLELHRITNKGGPAILLQHGILGDSGHWVTAGPEHALSFQLHDAGYDVFMGNTRGNPYSRRHISLSPKESEFWRWSFQEVAKYEIPAVTKRICKITDQEKIWFIGHSQGTLLIFVNQAGIDEETRKRIRGVIALAPILSLKHMKGPWRSLIGPFRNVATSSIMPIDSEFLPKTKASRWLAKLGKSTPDALRNWGSNMTRNFLLQIVNFDQRRYVQDRLEVFLSHTPAGTSLRNIVHFMQYIGKDRIGKFDHGTKSNFIHYNDRDPPHYDWKNVNLPVHLFAGTADWIATADDATEMSKYLNGCTLTILDDFDHLDFIWGKTARQQLHPKIFAILKA